jgi:HK97 family phage major capsid protein
MGMTFNRPKVTQHFDVGYQGAEKTELPGRDVKIGADTVTIHTFGGALNVSRQFIDRTPYWGRVFEDMVTTWANEINGELGGAGDGATAIKGLQTFATGLPVHGTGATLDGASLSTAVYGAWTDMVNGALKTGPDVAVMNATTWAKVASMVDASKRPLFPTLAPANASGTASLAGTGGFFGLPVVLDAGTPVDTIYLVNGDALEAYIAPSGEQPFTLSVDEPGILGVETAIYSYISTYAQPGGIGVVKLGATAIPLMVEPQQSGGGKASKEAA